MRVIQINAVVNTGSTGRIAEGIGQVLLEDGHESWIAYGRRAGNSASQLYRIGNSRDIYIHGLQSLFLDGHGFGSNQATRQLIRFLKIRRFDVIHLHNLHGYYLNFPTLFDFLKDAGTPVVWTFHDNWPITGHCTNFERVDCQKWKTGCHSCPLTHAYPRSLFDKSKRNYCIKRQAFTSLERLTIVTPSHWLADKVSGSFLNHYHRLTIPNGIDLKAFQRCDAKSPRPLILGVASVWPPSKGLADFTQLRTLLPADYRIVLIGLSKQQVARLPKGIEGIPRTESITELAEWYSRASVFVNPTYSDNFPTTNLEALACGTPVVTYQTGGSPESLSPGTGASVTTGNIEALAAKVTEWVGLSSPELHAACRSHAEARFSAHERFSDYLRAYKELLSS
jgi:putative colanic acid biosynthesis glycosyltransferase